MPHKKTFITVTTGWPLFLWNQILWNQIPTDETLGGDTMFHQNLHTNKIPLETGFKYIFPKISMCIKIH